MKIDVIRHFEIDSEVSKGISIDHGGDGRIEAHPLVINAHFQRIIDEAVEKEKQRLITIPVKPFKEDHLNECWTKYGDYPYCLNRCFARFDCEVQRRWNAVKNGEKEVSRWEVKEKYKDEVRK